MELSLAVVVVVVVVGGGGGGGGGAVSKNYLVLLGRCVCFAVLHDT